MKTRIFMLMLALTTASLPAFSQNSGADSLMAQYRQAIHEASRRLEADPIIVESIVYPELMRYSELRYQIEASLVSGMYVKFGLSQGDFSIGIFQMKPSFVEKLERRWNLADTLPERYQLYFNTMSRSEIARSSRVSKMMTVEGQCTYAAAFVRLMDYFFFSGQGAEYSQEDRVRLMAAAYNRGVEWPSKNPESAPSTTLEQLKQFSCQKTFHTGLVATPFTEYLNYSGLAAEHFISLSSGGSPLY